MVKTKITPIQRLLGDVGAVVNAYKQSDFKVDATTAEKAESLKPILLEKVHYDTHYSLDCGLFLNALVLATKIAKGDKLHAEFETACNQANNVVRGRGGIWP